jgi:hypothetical protein
MSLCYQRTNSVSHNAKTFCLQLLALPDMAAGSGPLHLALIVHHRMDEFLKPFLVDRTLLLFRRWLSTPRLWAAFLPALLTCVDQVSRASTAIPRYRSVSTHCIGSAENSTGLGFWKHLAVLAKSIAVLFENFTATLQFLSQCSSLSR